jgi:hypothetical protein
VALPVEYLQELGVVPSPPAVVADGPVEEVLDGYRRYMLSERGVKERTVAGYEPDARVFLSQRESLGGYKLKADERLLENFVAFLERAGAVRIIPTARCRLRISCLPVVRGWRRTSTRLQRSPR